MRINENGMRVLDYLCALPRGFERQKRVGRALGLGSLGMITEKLRESGLITKVYSAEAKDYYLAMTDNGKRLVADRLGQRTSAPADE